MESDKHTDIKLESSIEAAIPTMDIETYNAVAAEALKQANRFARLQKGFLRHTTYDPEDIAQEVASRFMAKLRRKPDSHEMKCQLSTMVKGVATDVKRAETCKKRGGSKKIHMSELLSPDSRFSEPPVLVRGDSPHMSTILDSDEGIRGSTAFTGSEQYYITRMLGDDKARLLMKHYSHQTSEEISAASDRSTRTVERERHHLVTTLKKRLPLLAQIYEDKGNIGDKDAVMELQEKLENISRQRRRSPQSPSSAAR